MADIFPPDYTSPVGQVRNYINDVEQRVDPAHPTDPPAYLFSDDRLNAFITGAQGTGDYPRVKFAAAEAIDAIADNEALVSKKIRTEDLQTDGPAVANSLRMRSATLRAQQKLELDEQWALDSVDIIDYEKPATMFDMFESMPYWERAY